MTRPRKLWLALACFMLVAIATGLRSVSALARARETPQSHHTTLTVSAAASLVDVLNELQRLYGKRHPDTKLIYNFGGSGMLLLQIEQGAPVDIFISAAPAPVDTLEEKGLLLAGTRVNLAENRMVLIVPSNSTNITGFADLPQPNVRVIALGEPASVPAGHYAQQVLEHMRIYQQVRPKVVLAKDVRQVLAYVETGDADAGIVYATDARITSRVRVIAQAPADSHDPVIYPAAVIRRSANPAEAREFLSFLAGPEARAAFVKYGFTVPPAGTH